MSEREPILNSDEFLSSTTVSSNRVGILPNNRETSTNGTGNSRRETISILIQAVLSLVLRLWLATMSVSILMYFVRRAMHPLVHSSGMLMDDRPVNLVVDGIDYDWEAIPAMFGQPLIAPISGPIMMIDNLACTSFEVDFPYIDTNTKAKYLQKDTQHLNITSDYYGSDEINWIGVVGRGGCPFDQKVLMMELAGFHATIVVNHATDLQRSTVRMSAHSLGSTINSFSAFMSYKDGIELKEVLQEEMDEIHWIQISQNEIEWFTKRSLMKSVVEMLILFMLVVLTGSGLFILGLCLKLGHNLAVHGDMFIMQTIHEASMLVLATSPETNPPKLAKITFPTRIVQESDLVEEWKSGGLLGHDNCPICIEEFEIGDTLRQLPCQHVFHSNW
ncbi:hypothetical protein HDV02_005537 [Globomyces sp. JEL0801]|nr:hypothetical protein HDV02_005537 [Globomyces sp. JEL0801]